MVERFLSQTSFNSQEDFIKNLKINVPENFNFGYDVVDAWAEEEPDKKALCWTNDHGEHIDFTFADLKRYTDQTASYFQSLGIGHGDMVMLILKRRYEFWYSTIALHKLGATVIPATHLLTKKDIIYRCNAADIKMIVAAGEGIILQHIKDALPECPTVEKLVSVGPEIPEGFEVYSCTGTEVPVGTSTALVLEKAESIEAHTPYIIKGKDGDTHDFSDYGMALQDQYAAGLMTGTFTQQKAVTNTYVLQNQEGKVGFYKVAAGSEPTIKPYRAYINADVAEANIVALLLPGIETGINGIVAEDALVNVYDLNGILVRENVKLGQALEGLSKGIYIVNGTKKAVK